MNHRNRPLWILLLVCCLVLPARNQVQSRPAADLIITNAKIWTVDTSLPTAQAVAVGLRCPNWNRSRRMMSATTSAMLPLVVSSRLRRTRPALFPNRKKGKAWRSQVPKAGTKAAWQIDQTVAIQHGMDGARRIVIYRVASVSPQLWEKEGARSSPAQNRQVNLTIT
jgi:hypothetical protein